MSVVVPVPLGDSGISVTIATGEGVSIAMPWPGITQDRDNRRLKSILPLLFEKKNLLVTKKGGMRDETALIPPSNNNTRYFTATRTITV